jgi:hypothetical protein
MARRQKAYLFSLFRCHRIEEKIENIPEADGKHLLGAAEMMNICIFIKHFFNDEMEITESRKASSEIRNSPHHPARICS